nr:unnamed protein product [Callosobruchus analis]
MLRTSTDIFVCSVLLLW